MPDDFFRTRLVCTLLETCGACFDRGTAKKKLDFFLTFFQVCRPRCEYISKLVLTNTAQYYFHTKEPLPMDIDFIIQDTYALTRPQWKLAKDFEEAGRAFAESVTQNYKTTEIGKTIEPDAPDEDSSDDEADDDELQVPEMEDAHSSSEEVEAEVEISLLALKLYADSAQPLVNDDPKPDSDFDEEIIVTRHQEERDPDAEADFDRELAKMMAESLDSRKFDRKPLFDVPLPMRRAPKDISTAGEDSPSEGTATPPNTMAFSLMTKKGNRQQVCHS